MHRVELKEAISPIVANFPRVPNAPCGVESYLSLSHRSLLLAFLMHRVELKDLAPQLYNGDRYSS